MCCSTIFVCTPPVLSRRTFNCDASVYDIKSSALFICFKQTAAYELRMSDWSSGVCSSDLVVARAREVLKRLEAGRQASGGLAAGLDELPVFAAQVKVEDDDRDALRERIAAIQPDAVTPREALDLIYELKRLGARSAETTSEHQSPIRLSSEASRFTKHT